MDDRGNWVGIAILMICGLSAGTMLAYIAAGERATWNGPDWLGNVIVGVGLALFVIIMIQQFRSWNARRGGEGGDFLGNDTRPKRKWWWNKDD